MGVWSPELTGVVIGGAIVGSHKVLDYFLGKRTDQRAVERDAVDEVTPLLDALHTLAVIRGAQGKITASGMRMGENPYRMAREDRFLDTQLEHHRAREAFENPLEKVHDDAAREACASYAHLAEKIGKAAAWVMGGDADEATAYLAEANADLAELDAARLATRAALGAARRA